MADQEGSGIVGSLYQMAVDSLVKILQQRSSFKDTPPLAACSGCITGMEIYRNDPLAIRDAIDELYALGSRFRKNSGLQYFLSWLCLEAKEKNIGLRAVSQFQLLVESDPRLANIAQTLLRRVADLPGD